MAVRYQEQQTSPTVAFCWGLVVGAVAITLLFATVAFASDGLDLPIGPKRPSPSTLEPNPTDALDPPYAGERLPLEEPPPPKVPSTDWFGERIPLPTGGVFIIDRSGSMGLKGAGRTRSHSHTDPRPSRLDQVVSETSRMLDALPPNARFDLVEYSTDGHPLWGKLQDATPSAVAEAKAWLAALYPRGGTQTGPHVAWALLHRGYAEAGDFFLLSDGSPHNPKVALEMILLADSARTRVHAFAFVEDNVPAEKFMEDVGCGTGGSYRVVRPLP